MEGSKDAKVKKGATDDAGLSVQDSARARKPYTLSKTREMWSEEEHVRFVDALNLYGKDWKKIQVS